MWFAHCQGRPLPDSAQTPEPRDVRADQLLADLRDRGVEDDVRVLKRQLVRLRERLDLVVLDEQDRLDARLPGDEELLPQRVVIGLAGLRAEHGKLPLRRCAANEVL